MRHHTPFVRAVSLLAICAAAVYGQANHLLISEIAHDTPTESGGQNSSEYIEIFNPTTTAVTLGDPTGESYFISDMFLSFFLITDDPNEQVNNSSSATSQFCYEFPAGTVIPPNGVVVLTAGKTPFLNDFFGGDINAFTSQPGNPQLFETSDMIKHHTSSSLNLSLTQSNNIDLVVLYSWDRADNFVRDHDMVGYNDAAMSFFWPLVLRSSANHTYNPDGNTGVLAASATTVGVPDSQSVTRISQTETMESATGGNGFGGHDETTEDLLMTCQTLPQTPGVVHPNLVGGLQLYQPAQAVITFSGATIVNNQVDVTAANSIGQVVGATWTFVSVPGASSLTNLTNPNMIDASFVPDVTGTYTVQVIVDDGVGSDTTQASVTISNTAPNMVVTGNSAFGSANVGSTSLTSPALWTIENTGNANLSVTAISSLNGTEFPLSSLPTLPATVAPGQSVTFDVSFTPGAVGARSGTLRITSNTGGQGTSDTDFGLTGNGTPINSPTLVVLGQTAFDAQGSGAPQSAIWTISNSGPVTLEITSITPIGVQAGDFSVSGVSLPLVLGPQTSNQVTVTYTPGSTSTVSANIQFVSNNGGTIGTVNNFMVTGRTGSTGGGGFNPTPGSSSGGGDGGSCAVHAPTASGAWLGLALLGLLGLARRIRFTG